MLRRVKLTNFKCFEQLALDCAPLNLLCGLNGMGKSTVIQAMLVLRQSLEAGELEQGRLVLNGDRVDLGTGSDILFEDAEQDVLGFEIIDHVYGEKDKWEQIYDCPRNSDILGLPPEVKARGLFDDVLEQDPGLAAHVAPEHLIDKKDIADLSGWDEPPFRGQLAYVGAERVGPRKSYPLSDMMARRGDLGTSGEYAWNYLHRNQDELLDADDPRCLEVGRRLPDVVDQWLQDVCPGTHLQLEAVTDADALIAGFTFDRPGDVASNRYRATNVGFGLSYTLPVIVALLSDPGTLCLIENPEAHLHPRGQTKLAELAARAARAGVQVFAETHSDHFMDGVRIAVRNGLIDLDDAAFHYFERDGNKSKVTSLKADSDGRLSHWPAGFFDQHEENLAKLIGPRP